MEIRRIADEIRIPVRVSRFPPGTSKRNKIEHRLFCHITKNWRGRPLRTLEAIVSLIGKTTTAAGLRVKSRLDKRRYPTGVVINNNEMKAIALDRHDFHGEWKYEISPRTN